MSDIFREVEEDVRREKLEKLWKKYGDYVIALIAVAVIGIAGFELWQRYQTTQRNKASNAFAAAQQITDPRAAAQAFADLAKTAPSGYRVLAQLEQANNMLDTGQKDSAITLYKQIANSHQGGVGAVARLRAAWALADTSSRANLVTLLAPLRNPSSAWRQLAGEVLAYSDFHHNHIAKAAKEFEALANDPQSPPQLRTRAGAMGTFLAQGGDKDFGKVPPTAPATLAAKPAAGVTAKP